MAGAIAADLSKHAPSCAPRTENGLHGSKTYDGEAQPIPSQGSWSGHFRNSRHIATRESTFVVLDAEDFAGEPAAVVKLPRRVPVGLHGTWCPAAS
jgi:Retinal pigment epithelial membrane protein